MLVVQHSHIDILGIVGGYPYFITISQLTLVLFILWNSLQLLWSLVQFVDDTCQFLHTQRTIIVHAMLVTAKLLRQIYKHLRISFLKLLLT